MLVKRSKSNKMQKNHKVSKKVNQRNKKTKKVGKMKGGARSAYAHVNPNNELPEPGDNNNENYEDDMFAPSKEEQERTESRFSGLQSLQENARGLNVETNTNVNLLPGRRGSKKRGRLSNTLFINREMPTNYARHAKSVGVKNHRKHFRKSSSNNYSNIEV
jgi:hypothetical protein